MSGKFLLANMLSSISNKRVNDITPIVCEFNTLCYNVLNVMQKAGYIKSFKKVILNNIPYLECFVTIKRNEKVFSKIKIYSKPGRRYYVGFDVIKNMLMRNKYKLYIISTSRGLMSGFESNKMNIGGELLCEIF